MTKDDFKDSDEVDRERYTANDLCSLGKSGEAVVKKSC